MIVRFATISMFFVMVVLACASRPAPPSGCLEAHYQKWFPEGTKVLVLTNDGYDEYSGTVADTDLAYFLILVAEDGEFDLQGPVSKIPDDFQLWVDPCSEVMPSVKSALIVPDLVVKLDDGRMVRRSEVAEVVLSSEPDDENEWSDFMEIERLMNINLEAGVQDLLNN